MHKYSGLKHILRVTLFAFIMNALLPFFAVYNLPSNSAEASELSSVFGDKILICTSDGFKLVSFEDFESGGELPAEHPKYECALCFVSNKNDKHFVPSKLTLTYAPAYETLYSRFFESDSIDSQFFYNIYPSRAPPLFS